MFDFAAPPPETPVPLQQSAVFNRAMMRLGVDLTHHALPGGSATVLMRRITGLGPTGVVSRGPVWSDYPSHIRVSGLAGMRRALGLRHLFINPEHPEAATDLRAAGFVRVAKPAQVAMLPLSGGPEEWLRRMDQKWRNRLRHAQKQGLVVERHDFLPRNRHWLFDKDREQQALRSFRNLPHPVLAEMARVEPGSVQLFLARAGEDNLAAMMFLRHGAMATYQIGWTTMAGKRVSAHNLLLWEALHDLAGRGHFVLDMGVLNARKTPGIDRFKLGAGAEVRSLGGTWLDSAWAQPLHRVLRAIRG